MAGPAAANPPGRRRVSKRGPLDSALPVLAGLALGFAVLLVLHLTLYNTYWDYSEGVYALSAHLLLHGRALYTQTIGAQPPGVFLTGAALLAVHNSVEWLRFALACLQLGAGLIAGQIVLRIAGNRLAAVLTPAGILLTPWAVHEHGALTPELAVLPVMLGAALLAGEVRRAPLAGILCGLLPMFKWPFAIPAIAIVVLSADPRRTARWAIATLLLAAGLTTGLAGASFWRETVFAQTQTGSRSLGLLKGFWAQAAWNVLGLLACAWVAVSRRSQAGDRRLLRISIGLGVAMIVTFLTNFKQGTGLNVTVPVEAALVPLSACGTVFAFRAARPRWVPGLCVIAILFTLAQSVSLIVDPRHSVPFLRAGSRPAWPVQLTGPQLRRAVTTARRCPVGVTSSGPPLIAFMASRQMADQQPDQFIISHARTLRTVWMRVLSVTRLCP